MTRTSVLILSVIGVAASLELPSNFKVCRRSDPKLSECVNEAAVQIISLMANGLPSFGVPPLEPLSVPPMSIGGGGGAVVLNQNYKNIKVHGLTKGMVITRYQVDLEKFVFKCVSFNPQIDFVADYSIDGRILLIPLRGNGRSNVTMYNLTTKSTYYGEKFEKDGEIYLRIKKYELKFSPKRIYLNFDNVIAGSALLSENLNSFLNANSELLFSELKKSYEESFAAEFANIANHIFTKVPLNKIYPL